MSQNKILLLLVVTVILVNYVNYFQQDRTKLFATMEMLEHKIAQARRLEHTDINVSALNIDLSDYFYDQNSSYSQSMGALQERVNLAARETCEIKSVKWAPVPTSKAWYQYLKLNVSLECAPSKIMLFVNRLKQGKLVLFKNVQVVRIPKKDLLRFNATIVAFKVNQDAL